MPYAFVSLKRLFSRLGCLLAVVSLFGLWSLPAAMGIADAATKTATTTKSTTSSSASNSNTAATNNISGQVTQSYDADATVQIGMIVSLKSKDPTTVIPLTNAVGNKILGVTIPNSNVAIVLTPAATKQQQILVATSGHYNVLVSNQNGPVKVGDYIAISAVSGVGMKADENQAEIIGKAAGNFTGSEDVVGSLKLKDQTGKQVSVAIGRLPVDINVVHNPLNQKTVDYVPGFLSSIAISIANKPVSVARIYLCTVILFAATVVTGSMLYSGVRSGMIAVGRNPLTKKSIIKSLIQTVIAGLIIFVVGVLAVYLLLKL